MKQVCTQFRSQKRKTSPVSLAPSSRDWCHSDPSLGLPTAGEGRRGWAAWTQEALKDTGAACPPLWPWGYSLAQNAASLPAPGPQGPGSPGATGHVAEALELTSGSPSLRSRATRARDLRIGQTGRVEDEKEGDQFRPPLRRLVRVMSDLGSHRRFWGQSTPWEQAKGTSDGVSG